MKKKYAIQIKNPSNNKWFFVINETSIDHPIKVIPVDEPPLLNNIELTKINLYVSEKEALDSVGRWINEKDYIRYQMQQSAPWITNLESLIIRTITISFEEGNEISYENIADKTYLI